MHDGGDQPRAVRPALAHLQDPRTLSVTVDNSGAVIVTTILGQTRTLTPYDYSAHLDPAPTTTDEAQAAERYRSPSRSTRDTGARAPRIRIFASWCQSLRRSARGGSLTR